MHLGLTSNSVSHRSPWGRWGVETRNLEALLSLSTYNFKFCQGKEPMDEELSAEQKLSCTDDFLFVIGTATEFGNMCQTQSHECIHVHFESDSSTPKSRISGRVYSNSHSPDDQSNTHEYQSNRQKFYRPCHVVGLPHSDSGDHSSGFIAFNYGTLNQGLEHLTTS